MTKPEPKIRVPKEKQLVKVVGTLLINDPKAHKTVVGRGIVQLKRSESVRDFAVRFLEERGVVSCVFHERAFNTLATAPIMFMNTEPKCIITYNFTQFDLSDIGYFGKDLTKVELFRDFKFLKKLLA